MLKPNAPKHTKGRPSPSLSLASRTPPISGVTRKRTSHACDRCRLMRVKCTGGVPCERCAATDVQCLYGDHKRQRNQKELIGRANRIEELESENSRLVSVLRQVLNEPGYQIQEDAQIMKLLGERSPTKEAGDVESADISSNSRSTRSPIARITNTEASHVVGGEETSSSSVGSPGRQGELHQIADLDYGTGAAGYIGKMSEMSWMQRCRQYVCDQMGPTMTNVDYLNTDQQSTVAGALRYFVDNQNLLEVDEDRVDPLHRPPVDLAIILTEACFHAIEGSFQFVLREQFLEFISSLPQHQFFPSWAQRRWLALANVIWAVGAKWLQLAKLDGPEFPDGHLTFYARARALGLDHRVSFDHPSVETVQGLGLLTFYLLINDSISRAWNTIGNAIRYAMTIGLHLHVLDPSSGETEQRIRARTWFSLYNLQILVVEITGRPPLVRTAHVTVPLEEWEHSGSHATDETDKDRTESGAVAEELWQNFLVSKLGLMTTATEEEEEEGLPMAKELPGVRVPQKSFPYHVRMCQLSEEVADSLYTGRHHIPWSQTQQRIEELQRGLDAWQATLPDDLRMTRDARAKPWPQTDVHLAMYAYSVAMMIHRPCLCVIHIPNESDYSKEFNIWSAQNCVNAAISMLDLMPDDLIPQEVYQALPWWLLPHYVCQAAAVLLLELCMEVQHLPGDAQRVLHAMLKAISLLARLARDSMSAYKAWRIFRSLLLKTTQQAGEQNLAGLIEEVTRPQRWTLHEENDLLAAIGAD